jgi:TusA-related sulfurtransferase
MIKSHQVIDAKGLLCPRPLLMTRQALKGLQPGEVLEVIVDDVATKMTFHAFLEQSGHELLQLSEEGTEIRHYIRKK